MKKKILQTLLASCMMVTLAVAPITEIGKNSAEFETSAAESDFYFQFGFPEIGDTSGWIARGSATISVVAGVGLNETTGLSVTGRTDVWNGAEFPMANVAGFAAGNTYSLSVWVKSAVTTPENFKFTMQYDLAGTTTYAEIASGTSTSDSWLLLENTEFAVPTGAENISVYVEMPDNATGAFYMDEVVCAVAGTQNPAGSDFVSTKLGDVNNDGNVNISDAVTLVKYILGSELTLNMENADLVADNSIDVLDLSALKYELWSKPEPPVTTTEPPVTTTQPSNPSNTDPAAYMQSVRAVMTNNVPGAATANPSQRGDVIPITYRCDFTGKMKKANVVLPVGYTTDKKYPVMYVNHGIMGSENDMIDDSMKVRVIAENLAKTGEAEEMIIVCANMYTSKTSDAPSGINQQVAADYDNFLYDLTESLMPYIEANYSVATGRENTAITGFSMGGREAMYIGLMRPDLFGYIGGACPAPGIVAASDMYMSHPGLMSESQMKFKDGEPLPYVFMVTGGTNDSVVGTFPQDYHRILTANNVDHIWQEIQGGGHDAGSVVPHMYNFIKAAFKA